MKENYYSTGYRHAMNLEALEKQREGEGMYHYHDERIGEYIRKHARARMSDRQFGLFLLLILLAILLLVVVFVDLAHAGTACGSPTVVDHYSTLTTSVGSSAAPFCVMPSSTTRMNFSLCADAQASVGAMCWPYTGTVPSAASANAIELAPGKCYIDSSASPGDIGDAWACVFKSGGTTLNVYNIFRSQ